MLGVWTNMPVSVRNASRYGKPTLSAAGVLSESFSHDEHRAHPRCGP
jgi:hypothetical protein